MKWKFLIQALIFMAFGAVIAITSSTLTIKAQQKVFVMAIDKNTSAINNTFGKVKNKKGATDLDLETQMQNNFKDSLNNNRKKFWKLNKK